MGPAYHDIVLWNWLHCHETTVGTCKDTSIRAVETQFHGLFSEQPPLFCNTNPTDRKVYFCSNYRNKARVLAFEKHIFLPSNKSVGIPVYFHAYWQSFAFVAKLTCSHHLPPRSQLESDGYRHLRGKNPKYLNFKKFVMSYQCLHYLLM